MNSSLLIITVFTPSSFKTTYFMKLIVIVSHCYKYVNMQDITYKDLIAESSSEAMLEKL